MNCVQQYASLSRGGWPRAPTISRAQPCRCASISASHSPCPSRQHSWKSLNERYTSPLAAAALRSIWRNFSAAGDES